MRMLLTAFSALVMLAGCVTSPASPSSVDAISLHIFSWGQPLRSWRMEGNGAVEVRTSEKLSVITHYRTDTRRATLSSDDIAQVDALMTQARHYAGQDLPCSSRIFDLPYGHVEWEVGGETQKLNFNSGCRDSATVRILDQIQEANALVVARTADSPIVASEEVRPK